MRFPYNKYFPSLYTSSLRISGTYAHECVTMGYLNGENGGIGWYEAKLVCLFILHGLATVQKLNGSAFGCSIDAQVWQDRIAFHKFLVIFFVLFPLRLFILYNVLSSHLNIPPRARSAHKTPAIHFLLKVQ